MPALRTRDTQSRSTLEVSTDALQPPALAIISPTPRAFTFPITHNLADSPYSSPSHSPFEPDLRALALTSTPPPFLARTVSRSPSPSSPSHRRRKSCSSDVPERRPRKGDDDYIKRPENAFILFRRKCCEDRQAAASTDESTDAPTKKQRQADLSKTISQQWKSLSAEDRQYWENLAKEKKKEHEALYPNYVYRPQRARDKDGRPKARKNANANAKSRRTGSDDDAEYAPDGLSFVVPFAPRHHGRSASAPTPPPYQSIQVPNVYHMTPSCPTSPSLMPMITRRASHPDHLDVDDGMPFDFHPGTNDGYAHPHAFDSSLQSSEFLQSMFNMAGLQHDTLHPLSISPSSLSSLSPSSSTSSGPSSPLTPASLLPHPHTQDFFPLDPTLDSLDPSLDPSLNLDLDLQMEMQLQHEFAQFTWGPSPSSSTMSMSCMPMSSTIPMQMPMPMSLPTSMPMPMPMPVPTEWTHPDMLLGNGDFDIGSISRAELDVSSLGVESSGHADPMSIVGGGSASASQTQSAQSGIESASQSQTQQTSGDYSDSEQGIIAFDQMMAGHNF